MSPTATDGLADAILDGLSRVSHAPESSGPTEPGQLDRIVTACLHDLADDRGRWGD